MVRGGIKRDGVKSLVICESSINASENKRVLTGHFLSRIQTQVIYSSETALVVTQQKRQCIFLT